MIIKIFKKLYNWIKGNNMELKSEVEKLSSRLLDIFQLEEGFVVALNGEWGIGKTYFWDLFVKKNLAHKLEKKEVVYVSLFGKETLKDIQTDIILQISKFGKLHDKITSIVGTSKIKGIDISSVLSLATKTDFEGIVICFDDFERKSDKLDSKDILGLISQFKEQKNCKIIMIYNQNEVNKDDKKIVSDYKDKVIDYELHYRLTVAESYNAVSSRLKVFKDFPLEYLELKGINNIRVIKRVINALNDFESFEDLVSKDSNIESELVYSIVRLALVNAKYHEFNLKNLKSYVDKKRWSDKKEEIEINKEYEDMLFLINIDSSGYLIPSDIFESINYYIENSIVDKDKLQLIIKDKIAQNLNSSLGSKIHDIYTKYNYDATYSKKDFAEDMFNALKEGEDNIVAIVNVGSFLFYVQEVEDIIGEAEIKPFAIEKLKKHLDHAFMKESLRELTAFGNLDKVTNYDTSLKDYIDNYEAKSKANKISSVEDIIELFQRPIKNGSWGNEPELLEMINKETYKAYILKSSDFLQEVMSFIRWTQGFSNGSGFEPAVNIIIEGMWELVDDEDEVYSFKIEKLLKHLNVIRKNEEGKKA